jgi:hypothetical protein
VTRLRSAKVAKYSVETYSTLTRIRLDHTTTYFLIRPSPGFVFIDPNSVHLRTQYLILCNYLRSPFGTNSVISRLSDTAVTSDHRSKSALEGCFYVSFDCTAVVFAVLDSPTLVHSDIETINQISITVTNLFSSNHRFSPRIRIAQGRLVQAKCRFLSQNRQNAVIAQRVEGCFSRLGGCFCVSFDSTAVVFAVLDSPILVHSDSETINQISITVTKLLSSNHRFSLRFMITQYRLVLAADAQVSSCGFGKNETQPKCVRVCRCA